MRRSIPRSIPSKPLPAFGTEPLESRQLLAAAVRAIIPTLYAGPSPQTPLANTITQMQFTPGVTASAAYYQFATDDGAPDATTSIYIGPNTSGNPAADAAIALFDADGNQMKLADADVGGLSLERLDITLAPKTPYILGVYSTASLVPVDISVVLPQQAANTALRLDAASGLVSFNANSGENTYNAPADPDFYPLDFHNGRDNGVVTVVGTALDVESTIGVLQEVPQVGLLANIVPGATGWRLIATASGVDPSINVAPSAGQTLADGKYLLSVAPRDFSSPARSTRIDVSATPLVAASIENETPTHLGAPLPTTLGQATLQRADILGSGKFYSFVAPSIGPITLEVSGPTVGTTLALYDETGQTLLAAHGRTTASVFSYTHDVTAGITYRVALAPIVGNAGAATLIIRQSYSPAAVSLLSGPSIQPNLTAGAAAGARFMRLTLPKDADAVSVRISPQNADGGNLTLRIVGGNLVSPITRGATAGNVLSAVLDARSFGREIDVAFTADNAALFDFSVAAIDVPSTLPANTPLSSVDLDTGDLSVNASLGAAGAVTAARFWSINTGAGATLTSSATGGGVAILAHYEEIDGALRLVDFVTPNTLGVAQRSATMNPGRLAAIAAIAARPDASAGSVNLEVNGARPIGVGISMAPEPLPKLAPQDPAPVGPYSSNLKIRNVRLRSPAQRDLWETIVPYRVSGVPLLTIKPFTPGGALALRVSVLNATNTVLETITTAPGQQFDAQPLTSFVAETYAGAKLRFLVEAIGPNIGDGIYTLELKLSSADPTPFQVTETTFNLDYAQNTPSIPLFEPIRDVTVNSFLESEFTQSIPYNSTLNGANGAIDVYRFTHGPTPFAVWTEQIDSVNTNIKLYRGRTDALDEIPGVSLSLDYFPSDRSVIDARIEMWNTDLAQSTFDGPQYEPGRNVWYVVVKNEEGSRGRYRLRVSDLSPQIAGPGFVPRGSSNTSTGEEPAGNTAAGGPNPGNHGVLTQTGPTQNPLVPAEPYVRANQFANGTFSTTSGIVSSGLMHKAVFWVDQAGFAQFTLAANSLIDNKVLALWRVTANFNAEFGFYGGTLVAFSNDVLPDGTMIIQTNVQPGAYYYTLDGTTSSFFQTTTVNAIIPLPKSVVIDLDPQSGTTAAANLARVDPLTPAPAVETSVFRTTFYKVIAPGGTQMGLTAAVRVNNPPPAGNLNDGLAMVSVTRLSGTSAGFTNGDAELNLDGSIDDPDALVTSTDIALPGGEYYIGIHRDRIKAAGARLHVSAQFQVPQSGTPDIIVDRVKLDPANGQTRVTIDLRNRGFATAGVSDSSLRFSNYPYPSVFQLPGFGPLGSQTLSYLWDPTNGTDSATFVADITNLIAERDEGNNSGLAVLNKSRPTLNIALADPLMDGDADPNVWGRYVSGVLGATSNIIITPLDADGPGDIYRTFFRTGLFNTDSSYFGAGPHTLADFDFGRLSPTSPINLNRFGGWVKDIWGLSSDVRYISANVVPKSQFFTTMTFDRGTRLYNLEYGRSIVRYDRSLSQILGASIPLVGDKRTKFILHLGARGTASLNPANSVSMPLGADIELTAFDKEIYKKNWGGATPVTDNFMVGTTLEVSGKTLDVAAAAASFQLRNLNLLNIRTPKIPLFSFGIPKVAAISANFSLGLQASLSAGLKVGLNAQIAPDPLTAPARVGFMSPTFVQPRIQGSAYISGDVEVLGFDIGSLEGRISLGLNITVGLDNNDPTKVFTFDELVDRIRFNVSGDLSFGLSASVIIIGEVWSWEPDPITFPLGGNTEQGIITNDPALPGPFLLRSLAEGHIPAEVLLRAGVSEPTVEAGSDPVGAYKLNAAPQIAIDPVSGFAMSVQVADSDPSPDQTRGELVFATRADAVSPWSALAAVPGSGDVANPVLLRTNNPNTPVMVVYQVVDLPGNTQDQTNAQRLAAGDLRYRTWNGAAWSAEAVLAGSPGGDSAQAVALDSTGTRGVAAWVHNDAAVPMDELGNYARDQQEIYAALWDDITQSWLAGEALTIDAVADSQPAVFADADRVYVVWIKENGASNDLYFATNDGTGWTAPAILPISGLAAGGKFTSVALGSEGTGRVNVLFNYRTLAEDRSADSKLYNRPTTVAAFADPATVEVVAEKSNFSTLRTTNLPDGSLVAYWKQGDGIVNEIFTSTLSPGATAWSRPMQLTQGSTIEQRPSVAVEPDGRLQVLYEIVEAGTGDAPASDNAPTADGVGATTVTPLPEVGFTSQLDFDQEELAVAGGTATGRATIINRGPAASDIFIDYLRGDLSAPTVLATRTIRLSSGGTYDTSFDFPIVAGSELYSIQLRTPGAELVGADDNISSYTLSGLPDLELVSLQLQNPNLPPGSGNPLQARIRNRSDQAIGPFSVDFRSGDELFPQNPWSSIVTISVPSLAAGAEVVVSTVLAVPQVSGLFEFSAVIDSAEEIDEASELNNRRNMRISRLADPGLTGSPQLVAATLLNSSGMDNVRISANLFNFAGGAAGSITGGPVTVRLLRSLDDEDFVEIASQSFASVPPGGLGQPVMFITSGLAGDNRYRVLVVPDSLADDSNPFNNIGEARLQIRGLPDLSPTNVQLSQSSVPQGAAVTVMADIVNLGIAAARDVLIEVVGRRAGEGGVVFGSLRVPRIDPLSTVQVEIPLDTSALAGSYELIVIVNRSLDVLEITDANNSSSPVQLTITAAGPFALSSEYQFDGEPGYVIAFNKAIAGLDNSDIELLAVSTGLPIPTAQLDVVLSGDGREAFITYLGDPTGALPDDNYTISIPIGAFVDLDGNPNADPFSAGFFVFAGDADRDRTIGIGDFAALASHFNQAGVFSDGDFDYSGAVEIGDFATLASKFNTSLPAPRFAAAADSPDTRSTTASTPAFPRAFAPATRFSNLRVAEALFDEPRIV